MSTIEERVAAGVAWLDANYEGDWRDLINLDALDLDDDVNCILGQLYGTFSIAPIHDDDADECPCFEVGFNINYETGGSFEELTSEWKRVLSA